MNWENCRTASGTQAFKLNQRWQEITKIWIKKGDVKQVNELSKMLRNIKYPRVKFCRDVKISVPWETLTTLKEQVKRCRRGSNQELYVLKGRLSQHFHCSSWMLYCCIKMPFQKHPRKCFTQTTFIIIQNFKNERENFTTGSQYVGQRRGRFPIFHSMVDTLSLVLYVSNWSLLILIHIGAFHILDPQELWRNEPHKKKRWLCESEGEENHDMANIWDKVTRDYLFQFQPICKVKTSVVNWYIVNLELAENLDFMDSELKYSCNRNNFRIGC